MASASPASAAAPPLSKLGVLRLGAEYLHPGSESVSQLFEAARQAMGPKDFSQPIKVLTSHLVETVSDLRLLIVENQLRELGLPIRLCVWIEEEVAKLSDAASAAAGGINVTVAPPVAAPLPPIPLSAPVRPRHTAGTLSDGAGAAAASGALVSVSPSPASPHPSPSPSHSARAEDKVALFSYGSDFDTRGLMYYLGSQGSKGAWSNPASRGLVTVSSSGLGKDSAPLDAIVGREVVRCVTGSSDRAFVQLELTAGFWLRPSHYTLRHYASYDSEALRDWKLEGSNDGGATFTLLKEHRNDCNLHTKGGSCTWSLDLDNPSDLDRTPAPRGGGAGGKRITAVEALANPGGSWPPRHWFKLFRVTMLGPNSNAHLYLACSGWEMYGAVMSDKQMNAWKDALASSPAANGGGAGAAAEPIPEAILKSIPSWSPCNDPWPLPSPAAAEEEPEDTSDDLLEDEELEPVKLLTNQLSSLSFTDQVLRELVAAGGVPAILGNGGAKAAGAGAAAGAVPLALSARGNSFGSGSGAAAAGFAGPTFVYSSDFDRNGIIWALATANSTKPWRNPSDAGLVALYASSLMEDSHPLSAIVARETVRCVTKPLQLSWIVLDFLADKRVHLTHYSLKHYSSWDSEALRSWRLEASRTGGPDASEWFLLREHVHDENLTGKGGTFTWSIPGGNMERAAAMGANRYLRIIQTGENSNKHHYLALSGMELYGRIMAADGVTPYDFSGSAPPAQLGGAAAPSPSLLAPHAFPSVAAAAAGAGAVGSGSVYTFVPQGDFDQNGLLYFLGTAGRTRAWSNPILSGLVRAEASSLSEDSEPLAALAGMAVVRCVTQALPEQWMGLDLGPGRLFSPTHYSLRHYSSWDTEALRNWRLQGSLDGDLRSPATHWVTLLEHREDEALFGKGATHTWALPPSSRAWRLFRIFQYEKNSNRHHYLACSGWEMYGTLRAEPPLDFGPVAAAQMPAPMLAPQIGAPLGQAAPAIPMRPASLSLVGQAPASIAGPVAAYRVGPAPAVPLVAPQQQQQQQQQQQALALHGSPAPVAAAALLPPSAQSASGSALDVWDPVAHGQFLQVLPSASGSLVRNAGSADKWQLVRVARGCSAGVMAVSIRIVEDPATTNTWRFILGVVPAALDCKGAKQWVGVGGSWGYIGGTGGKCHSAASSLPYGAKFGRGDVVTAVVHFASRSLSFYRNDEWQGVAFGEVTGEVHVAASLTAKDAALQIVPTPPAVAAHAAQMANYAAAHSLPMGMPPAGVAAAAPAPAQPALAAALVAPLAPAASASASTSAWDPACKSAALVLDPLDPSLVRNSGSSDKWQSVRSLRAFSLGLQPARATYSFEVALLDCPRTNNSWSVIVGVVPAAFTCSGSKQWVGAAESWGYIGGTGGKLFAAPKSLDYGEKFGAQAGDTIRVTLDFQKQTIEFAKNGVSQGVAFTNLVGPVYAAVSLTATGATAKLTIHP